MSRLLTNAWNALGIFAFCGVILIVGTGCDGQQKSVRATGGERKDKLARNKTAEKNLKEAQDFIETEVIENSNALALKASLEYMESTRAMAALVKYLKTEDEKRAEYNSEISFTSAKTENDAATVEIKQSQSSSLHNVTSAQTFEIIATQTDKKMNFDKMQIRWREEVKVERKSKNTTLEINHEFDWVIQQETDKILVFTSKDAKIQVNFSNEKVHVESIADLSFKMVIEDLGHIVIKELKIEKPRLSSQNRVRSRAPVLVMDHSQTLQLQLRQNPERPKGMSAICYDLNMGSFKSGDDTTAIDARLENNRLTLQSQVVTLSSCPTSNFVDALKWMPKDRSKKTTPNLKVDRSLLDE